MTESIAQATEAIMAARTASARADAWEAIVAALRVAGASPAARSRAEWAAARERDIAAAARSRAEWAAAWAAAPSPVE